MFSLSQQDLTRTIVEAPPPAVPYGQREILPQIDLDELERQKVLYEYQKRQALEANRDLNERIASRNFEVELEKVKGPNWPMIIGGGLAILIVAKLISDKRL